MNNALRLNPEQKAASLNLLSVGLAGPALMYVGVRYGPTLGQKIAFAGLGLLLIASNGAALRETFTKPSGA
jgi:hypothetical protein